MSWTYLEKADKQLKNWYNEKARKNQSGFDSVEDFLEWYKENVSNGNCFYCGVTEREIQLIVHNGNLTSKRFPQDGKFLQGVNRGYWLEIDRKNPQGIYSKENSVPCCYFCNNDKSDVFTAEQYMEFIKDRASFLKKLSK
jgi:hypothetical protein